MLEMMVAKANNIYVRWASGQDVSSLVLRHDARNLPEMDGKDRRAHSASDYVKTFMAPQPTTDPFATAHPNLSQCIAEVHQRALTLFPLRKPCQCATRTPAACSSPHSAVVEATPAPSSSPVLPEMYTANIAYGVLCGGTPDLSPNVTPPAPAPIASGRMAVVDTLNFDFGALNPSWDSDDQNWMAWF
jgi:hypothetical protein